MSLCKDFGKDKVIFATKEDHAIPSSVSLPDSEPAPGLILENGDINWNCPCLGGMATGPCGVEFREAFSCFHYSEADPKGSDCYESFKTMQDCFAQYPTVYNKTDDDDDMNLEALSEGTDMTSAKSSVDSVEPIEDDHQPSKTELKEQNTELKTNN